MTLVDPREGLRSYLLGDAGIATAVGNTRIFPLTLKQGVTATSIVYSKVSAIGDHHNDGPSGLARPRMQIDSWAPTLDAAVALALKVKERIDGFKGPMPYGNASPPEEITVRGIFFDAEREDYDAEAKLYRVSQDYFVWFAERAA